MNDGVSSSAILYICVAMLVFTGSQACGKYLVLQGVAPLVIGWMSMVVHSLLVGFVMACARRRWWKGVKKPVLQCIRGVLILVASMTSYFALAQLQLAELVSIAFLAPFIIVVLAVFFLGEPLDRTRLVVILVGFLGVLVITRPGLGVLNTGHLMALISVLIYSVFTILTRRLGQTESADSMIIVPAIAAVLVYAPAVMFTSGWPGNGLEIAVLTALGTCSALGHGLLVLAYRAASASALAPYNYVQMIWSVALGYFLFNQLPDFWTLVGALIIGLSGLYLLNLDRRNRLVTIGSLTHISSEKED